jgi:hypothetical protein
MYNQRIQSTGTHLPLLMGYTRPSQIQEMEKEAPIMYDPVSQTVFDMQKVGTKSLKTSWTKVAGKVNAVADKKNEIDDSKSA